MEIDFSLPPGAGLPLDLYRRLHEAGPVVWSETLGGWAVSGYDAVREVFGDVTRFTTAGTPVAEALGEQGMVVNDTPLHHRLRAVWAKHVGVAAMERRMRELEANAVSALAAVEPRLAAGDIVPVFRGFVIRFITSSFGLPPERAEIFHRWSELSADAPAVALEEGSAEQQRHFAVREAVFALIDDLIADRKRRLARGESPDDLATPMVAAEGSDGITASVVRDNLFNFILGALDTTEKWLGNIVVKLCDSPDLAAALRADRRLIAPFAEEVMRCDSVAQAIQRRVRQHGAELGGHRLREGDAIFLLLGAANRDARAFPDPDRFDMHRMGSAQLGFGFGFHHCLGVSIARAEARAFTQVLLDRPGTLQLADQYFGDSWALWGPRRLELIAGG